MIRFVKNVIVIREAFGVLKRSTNSEKNNTEYLIELMRSWNTMMDLSFQVHNNLILRALVGTYLQQVDKFSKLIFHNCKTIYTKIYTQTYVLAAINFKPILPPHQFIHQHSIYSKITELESLLNTAIYLYNNGCIEDSISQDFNISQSRFSHDNEIKLCKMYSSISEYKSHIDDKTLDISHLKDFLDTFDSTVISCRSETESGITLYNVPQVIPIMT